MSGDQQQNITKVWDPLLRIFHWLLVLTIAISWWTQGNNLRWHLLAGGMLGGLLMFRGVWGVAGDIHARFHSFFPSMITVRQHAKLLLHGRAMHTVGHPPLGALMVFALLLLLTWMWLSGLALVGLELGAGPLAGWADAASFTTENWLLTLHQGAATLLLWMVGIHLSGVLVESWLSGENLVAAMITGKKRNKSQLKKS